MIGEYQIAQARLLLAVSGAAAGVAEDLWRRRVSNTVCLLLLGAGLALAGFEQGMRGLGSSALGAAAGFSVFLVFYLVRAMGGGDVKLMAGYGAMLGTKDILLAAMIAAMAGAVIALAVVALARCRGRRAEFIPYAPAIAIGVLSVLLSRAAGGL